MIDHRIERSLHRVIESEARSLGCTVVAINGMHDHVHVLVKMPTTVTIAQLAKQLKGVSSRWANANMATEMPFKWQGHYGAFSVSRWDVDRVANYIRHQKKHHGTADILEELEQSDEEIELGEQPPR
jgi:REP element-mobilizing transposase RayT